MAEYTYPVIVKPMQSRSGALGIEYWFPDFEECEHIFYPDINDDGAATDMTAHLFMLLTDRQNACDRRPTPKWYGANDYPPNAQLRFITVNTNDHSGYFAEKGEEKMKHGMFSNNEIVLNNPFREEPLANPFTPGAPVTCGKPVDDAVNHPQHYTQSGIECIDAIDSVTSGYERPSHGYYAGQVLKYLWRAPFKGHYLQDLEKAQWYLNRLVKKVQDEVE